jgi:hypothetical protein
MTAQWSSNNRLVPKLFISFGVFLLGLIAISLRNERTIAVHSTTTLQPLNAFPKDFSQQERFLSGSLVDSAEDAGSDAAAIAYKVIVTEDDEPIFVPLQPEHSKKHVQDIKMHKNLFPMDTSDIIGTLLVGIGLMIAASGGIGGGGILVPLLIIVYGFHPKFAIPLSNFTILGSSITNMVLNLRKRHPDANRPLVDWDLILVMEPLTMAGAVSFYTEHLEHCCC